MLNNNFDSNKKTVLIVDDELDILDILEDVMGEYYNVVTQHSAEMAKSILKIAPERIDACVFDITMPYFDGRAGVAGFDLMTEADKAGIPFIAFTGTNLEKIREHVQAATMANNPIPDFTLVEKPFIDDVPVFLEKAITNSAAPKAA